MSGAAVISIRIKRVFKFLRDRGAISPQSAILKSEIPYSNKWYFQRIVKYGAIKQSGSGYYLDEYAAQNYIRSRRIRAITFMLAIVALYGIYLLITELFK